MQMLFSQTYGYSPAKQAIQMESMDSELRNSLWNAADIFYWQPLFRDRLIGQINYYTNPELHQLCSSLWITFFKVPLDTLGQDWGNARSSIRSWFFECSWFRAYDFIEFLAKADQDPESRARFEQLVNDFLEQESSAYRFTGGTIAPITNEVEIEEIDEAIAVGSRAVSDQMARALELLSHRQAPNYRNSVKESISAVESQVIASLGKDNGTLGNLLNQLEQKTPLHPALKESFSRLYGYTSDEGGIRHALLEDSRQVTFEEAKFMLVACSAFINYVRGISGA